MSFLGESFRVAFVILAGLGLVSVFLRHRSAELRNQAYRILVVAAWLMPVTATSLALFRRVQVPVLTISPSIVRAAPSWVPQSALPEKAYVVQGSSKAHRSAASTTMFKEEGVLFLVNLIGLAILMVRVISGAVRFGQIVASTEKLPDFRGIQVVRTLDPSLRVPITSAKMIVLPSSSTDWPESRIEASIRHEAAHVDRRDFVWQVVTQAFCGLNWYNPAVYLLAKALRASAEEAADDAVLNSGFRSSAYAQELLEVAKELGSYRTTAIAMVGQNGLQRRLRAIVDIHRDRRPVTLTLTVVAATLLAGLTFAIGGLTTRMPQESLSGFPNAIVVPKDRSAHLPDGTKVWIDSVQSVGLDKVVTWDSRGQEASPPDTVQGIFDLVPGSPRDSRFQVFNLGASSSSKDLFASFKLPEAFHGYASTVEPALKDRPARLRVSTPLLGDPFSTDLAVGLAVGPWEMGDRLLDAKDPKSPHLPPRPLRKEVNVWIPRYARDAQVRFTAYSDKGRALAFDEYGPGTEDGENGTKIAFFGLVLRPGERVDKVKFEYRPYQWVVFKDVCLQPNADALAAARRPKLQRNSGPPRLSYSVVGVEAAR